jgi:hypothetical protein
MSAIEFGAKFYPSFIAILMIFFQPMFRNWMRSLLLGRLKERSDFEETPLKAFSDLFQGIYDLSNILITLLIVLLNNFFFFATVDQNLIQDWQNKSQLFVLLLITLAIILSFLIILFLLNATKFLRRSRFRSNFAKIFFLLLYLGPLFIIYVL